MWIHESFGAYAEALYIEYFYGYAEALIYINGKKQNVKNDKPIIGPYNVNKSGSHDMYIKGQLVLNTLRNVIDNDSIWFAVVKGLHETFKYQSIDGNDVFSYINNQTGQDFTYFFTQYLKFAKIPQFEIFITKKGDHTTASYKWNADVNEFRMPIKVTTSTDKFEFIYPTTSPQIIQLGSLAPEDFRIADDLFYVNLNLKWIYLDPNLPEN